MHNINGYEIDIEQIHNNIVLNTINTVLTFITARGQHEGIVRGKAERK